MVDLVELQLLNYILEKKDFSVISNNNITNQYFTVYINEFEFIKNHYNTYNVVPDKYTFIDKFEKFEFIEVTESINYLIDKLEENHQYQTLAPIVNEVSKAATKDSRKATELLISKSAQLIKKIPLKAIDLIADADLRLESYLQRSRDFINYYIGTGFKELDEIKGGWDRKRELAIIQARTGIGKTWVLLKSALSATMQGFNVGIISGEMDHEEIGYRIDTMYGNISNWKISRGSIDVQSSYEKVIKDLKQNVKGTLETVTPLELGGSITVSKIKTFIQKYNLDIIFIDQYSLLVDERNGRSTTEQFFNLSKDLKLLQVSEQIPIIIVSQENRSEREEDGSASTKNTSGSDRIAQDATCILSLEQKIDLKLLVMKIVKARGCKTGDKLTYYWDIDNGIFTFVPTENDATQGKYTTVIKESYDNSLKTNKEDVF